MAIVAVLGGATVELALFAGVGFLVFALDDLAVDLAYFSRRWWRAATVYTRYRRSDMGTLAPPRSPGWLAVLIPAWDEGEVIGDMLRAALDRFEHDDYRIFVGLYRNDKATASALAEIDDPRVTAVRLARAGPTTKADCLNGLYDALLRAEALEGRRAKAVVLHDAEDVVHPLELQLFDRLIERAAVIQLPVVPLPDSRSRWIAGHYGDEFAEAHGKELVVREAIGAAIPLAGVGCAISRSALDRIAALHGGRPFADESLTEDYELGLSLGAIGERAMFVRLPATRGGRAVVASRGHFPTTLGAAVRQKARWIGGIAFSGWDRLGWRGGLGERWMRMRDRRGPLAAFLLTAGYLAALLWAGLWIGAQAGLSAAPPPPPALLLLLQVTGVLLLWRIAVRAGFTTAAYGWREGLRSIPRVIIGNIVAILAARRALFAHARGGAVPWDKTHHTFPAEHRAG